jgi:pimeloyl-ACP methyl ester carboxylesterase
MPTLQVNDTSLHYEDSGPGSSGQTIVFSHGLLWNTALFEPQARRLQQTYRCVRYDHRGQGRSADSDRRSIDMGTLTADAVALLDKLIGEPVHFVGLSMGGFVGMRIAARRPELLRSLTLMDTTAEPEPDENILRYRLMSAAARRVGVRPLAGQVMPILFGKTPLADPAREHDRARWREQLLANRRSVWRAVNGVLERESVTAELERITAPTLVLVGSEDVATGVHGAEGIQRGIRDSKLVVVPDAGHSAPVEQPEAVTHALEEFLSGLPS